MVAYGVHTGFVHTSRAHLGEGLGVHSIGARLKAWRDSFGWNQAEAASHLQLSASTYQNYERDVRAPNTEGWEAFYQVGINTNWLLSGQGPMLLKDLQPKPQPMKINIGALAATLDGATRGLPPGTSPRNIAEFAVKMYLDALEKGLITPDGIGEGSGEKSA